MHVFNLAKETGWSEDTILDMPIWKFHAYTHCLMLSYDKKTRYIYMETEKAEIVNTVNAILQMEETFDETLEDEFSDLLEE